MQHHCTTCRVSFDNIAAVREHYGSDLHLRNVKKRVGGDVSSLPQKPIQSTTTASSARYYCSLSKKYFNSVQTLQNHLQSKAHKQRVKAQKEMKDVSESSAAAEPEEVPSRDRHDDVEVTALHCFFSGQGFNDIETNLAHMEKSYGFVIPQKSKCTDLPGLMAYLARKVNGCLSLFDNRVFDSLTAARMHMIDTGRCRIQLDEEYAEFYDPEVFADPEEAPAKVSLRDGRSLVRRGEVPAHRELVPVQRNAWAVKVSTEQHAAQVAQDKKQIRESKRDMQAVNKYWCQTGVKSNKLHPKGYDGEA